MNNWNSMFRYDSDTGNLYWLPRAESAFKTGRVARIWNTRFVGTCAGTRGFANGRRTAVRVNIKQQSHPAHRIIWEMHNGPIPEGLFIDHINCDPWDNRLGNLRLATTGQNNANMGISSHNNSGAKGVSWHSKSKRWRASVCIAGKPFEIGKFMTVDIASRAYSWYAHKMRGDFARTA